MECDCTPDFSFQFYLALIFGEATYEDVDVISVGVVAAGGAIRSRKRARARRIFVAFRARAPSARSVTADAAAEAGISQAACCQMLEIQGDVSRPPRWELPAHVCASG